MSEADSEPRAFTALPAPESDEAPSREARGRWLELPEAIGIFALTLIAALCGGLIAVYWPWNGGGETGAVADRVTALEARVAHQPPSHPPPDQRKAIDALKTRLDADEARLAALEQSAPVAQSVQGSAPIANDALSARVARLEADTLGMKQELGTAALKSDEAALSARIAWLESRDPGAILKRAGAMMALTGIERASANGQPFVQELANLRATSPDLPEIATLARYAATGADTRDVLKTRLTGDAARIIEADREAHAKNWAQRLWLHIADLVSIRRVGHAKGRSTDAVIARAEAATASGDIEQALKEMNALDAPARAAANDWIAAATARIALDAALKRLAAHVLAMMTTPQPAAAPPVAAPIATVPPR